MRWADLSREGCRVVEAGFVDEAEEGPCRAAVGRAMIVIERQERRGEFVFAREDGSPIRNARQDLAMGVEAVRPDERTHSRPSAQLWLRR